MCYAAGMRALASLFWIVMLMVGCAGGARVSASTSPEQAAEEDASVAENDTRPDAGSALDAGADSGDGQATAIPNIDPTVADAVVKKTGEGAGDAPLGLRFEVTDQGPNQPWLMAVVNRGNEPVSVVFDSRLIRLEVEAPPPPPEPEDKTKKKAAKPKVVKPPKPRMCELPRDIVPSSADTTLLAELEPGEGLVQAFDPRLYCVPHEGKPVLVAGARVTARFGWPEKTKTVWRGGQATKVPTEQKEPFVAKPLREPAPSVEQDAGSPDSGANAENAKRRVKELQASPLTLGDEYILPTRRQADVDLPLELRLVRGSDAANEFAATITVAIKNRSKTPQRVFFRREFVSFEVSGPDGFVGCVPGPDDRAPEAQAFTTLRPGGEIRAISRLAELCPANTFARPGLYLVHARVDLPESGARQRIQAFTGRVTSVEPASIRIRKGELPSAPPSGAMRVRVGG